MKILVTGGAGYIGSHTCVELLNAGYEIVVLDNLSNSKKAAIERVKQLTGRDFPFYIDDVRNEAALDNIFLKETPDAVIHFAGLKAVGESVTLPLMYYENNLVATLVLLKMMKKHKVNNIVFSSSATVYGNPTSVPITEGFPLSATNPYGETKLMIERILTDCAKSDPNFNPILLRYFNPIGAHESGMIGEDPNGIPNNLVPYIAQVAVGKLKYLSVFGADYDTKDGTGVRDYIHVVDLALGHVAAIKKLEREKTGLRIFNLGTGKGYSVLEVLHSFERACGHEIPYQVAPRRSGDIAKCYADTQRAKDELGWSAHKDLDEMCSDAWKWQVMNPNGYDD